MLINLRNALMAGKRTPTAKDYVQDAAVFLYDGIENAGFGVHSSTIDRWVDLIGGAGDATIYNGANWGDDSLRCLTQCFARSNSLAFSNTVLSGTYTVELLVRPEATGVSNGGFLSAGDNRGRIFWVWERNPKYTELIDAIQTAQGQWDRPETGRTTAHLLQLSVAPTSAFFAVDGVTVQTKTKTSTATMTAEGFDIGRIRINANTNGYIGNVSICRCMLHSSALTADEIAANYAIDKARFNLP